MNAPAPESLSAAFGLADLDPSSLTPWASVHRGHAADGTEVVVKRTAGEESRARAMADWTRALAGAGLPVVTPVDLPVANPQPVAAPADMHEDDEHENDGDDDEQDEPDWFVVYPFVAGRPYAGTLADVEAAGDLLGRLHAVQLDEDLRSRLRPYSWTNATREDVDRDLKTLAGAFAEHVPDRAQGATANIRALADRWWGTSLPALLDADEVEPLPRAGVTSDWKASNLVWAPEEGTAEGTERPVLVDPDNGGLEPRILDLALALVLFHNECPSAPGRLLTEQEWQTFAAAYLRHVELTERERALWPAAVDHMLWEEGTWVLEDNDADAWADPRQGGQLLDLALTTPERYPLP